MPKLHIVQAGITNGDKANLERLARRKHTSPKWIAPKSVLIGDDVVIHIPDYGFFATAKIISLAKPRHDWPNRYGAGIGSIKLIQPSISLGTIRRRIPRLTWANYPRSITTPPKSVANQITNLIRVRRVARAPELRDDAIESANIDELRAAALLAARPNATKRERKANCRYRSRAIHKYVLRRAEGYCEACKMVAPFCKADGSCYLEPHHTIRLSDDGPDDPWSVIAVCPNCRRRAHHAEDAKAFNDRLIKRLRQVLEPSKLRR